jgi:hypothetical protein
VEALGQSLKDSRALLDPLRRAYQEITPGVQARLHQPVTEKKAVAELVELWCLVGAASYEVDRWFAQQGLLPQEFGPEECAYRRLGELMGGWPAAEQLRIAQRWREFIGALREDRARLYELGEVEAVTMYAEPHRELEFREVAERQYGWLHSFELANGVHELWLSPSIRFLFARRQWGPVLLDIVHLSGRDEDSWTPKWYVDRARCREEDWGRRA